MDALQLRSAEAIAASLGFPVAAYVARVEHFEARPTDIPVMRSPESSRLKSLSDALSVTDTVDALMPLAQSVESLLARWEDLREVLTPDAAELFAFHHARVVRRPVTRS